MQLLAAILSINHYLSVHKTSYEMFRGDNTGQTKERSKWMREEQA